jgi:molybdopterin-synthase adenylyltransferase
VLHHNDRLRIPDRFTLIPAGPDEYRLHSLTFSLALRGRSSELLSRLLPLLDGERKVSDVVTVLDDVGEEAVHEALERLLEAGALERADAGTETEHATSLPPAERERLRSQIAFFSHFVVPPGTPGTEAQSDLPRSGLEYQARLARARVLVVGLGRLGSHLARALACAGVGTLSLVDSSIVSETDLQADAWFTRELTGRHRAEAVRDLIDALNPAVRVSLAQEPADLDAWRALLAGVDFAVLCRDDVNPAEYDVFNRAALASKTTWTSARLSGFELHIGPTVLPYETACYTCFDLRQKSHVPDIAEHHIVEAFQKTGRLRPEALAFTPGTGLLALEVLKAISWFMPPATYAHLYVLNLLTMESTLHPVLKLPRCAACGRPAKPRPTIHTWQQSHLDPVS